MILWLGHGQIIGKSILSAIKDFTKSISLGNSDEYYY